MPAEPIFINTAIARREALILIKPPYLPPRLQGEGYLDAKWHPSAETGRKEARGGCRQLGRGGWGDSRHKGQGCPAQGGTAPRVMSSMPGGGLRASGHPSLGSRSLRDLTPGAWDHGRATPPPTFQTLGRSFLSSSPNLSTSLQPRSSLLQGSGLPTANLLPCSSWKDLAKMQMRSCYSS